MLETQIEEQKKKIANSTVDEDEVKELQEKILVKQKSKTLFSVFCYREKLCINFLYFILFFLFC